MESAGFDGKLQEKVVGVAVVALWIVQVLLTSSLVTEQETQIAVDDQVVELVMVQSGPGRAMFLSLSQEELRPDLPAKHQH